ncbi:hypothetical protein ACQP25_16885 [Microtetraspora malaysiensis]|uniref:hypothetical protein n=1 Tax=Microtetraspora malaysiensis TaxID=161358 RepID=UPI003D8C82E5
MTLRRRAAVVDALTEEGVPEKVVLRKVEHLERGLMGCGASPYYALPPTAAT